MDPEDLGRRLVNWYEWGYLAVDGKVFDVGIQTRAALANVRAGTPALMAGPKGERDNGNGSLMRVLPLALWHPGDDAKLASDAMAQSRVTHGHMRSQVCCAVYCLWARRVLDGAGAADAWTDALDTFRELYPEGLEARTELDTYVARPDAEEPPGTGSGYVVDCLRSARQCVAAGRDYEGVVKAAVRLGHDTDTTAAVAGGMRTRRAECALLLVRTSIGGCQPILTWPVPCWRSNCTFWWESGESNPRSSISGVTQSP